ncbi:MAG: molybdate ABC transporter substrate-binding protein [Herpetosiphonaceae bacterium]|nr:molybdate ABC transporter substrate-binding protein [Herpetosiphonaceae bacterium]
MRYICQWLSLLGLVLVLAGCGASQAAVPATTVGTVATAVAISTSAPTEISATMAPATATAAATEAMTAVAAVSAATTAATSSAAGGELTVFAAASLTDAFRQIGKNFAAANSGSNVTFNFAGSQQLAQQIGQGAPADVFAAASAKTMNDVITSGQVVSGTQRTFVRNRLVVVFPKDNPAGVKALKDLAKPGLKLDLAAKAVPVGQYALDFLDKASKDPAFGGSFKTEVLKNVVSYEDNVKAVLAKVTLGEADVGIVYTTDISLDGADKVGRVDIPDALNTIASYPIAAIKGSKNAELAAKFVSYVLAPEGQQVLVKYGFIPTIGSATGAVPGSVPLVVAGLVTTPVTLTADDLRKMAQVSIKATDKGGTEQTYSGVAIATVLAKAGVKPEATKIVFTGGDGYAQTLSLQDIQTEKDAIIVIDPNGSLRNILPKHQPKFWVKGLVKIDLQ